MVKCLITNFLDYGELMLENINSPKDLKQLNNKQLENLASEIRQTIISTVSQNGGHLASNLGIVEATIALHKVFDLPSDKIVFDVGHQCYTHKLLTGRYQSFNTLRKCGGISGFTNRDESEYDTFTAGHSGSSVSLSLGLSKAMNMAGSDNYTVAVVGDGSFTNGMIYEALNNCNHRHLKLIILLNDNEMSISQNVGSLAKYLSKIRTSTRYFKFKHDFQQTIGNVRFIGKPILKCVHKVKNLIKVIVFSKEPFFSNLGVKYLGPVDGNDLSKMQSILNEAKLCGECCLVHIKTKKGKGYKFSQEHPEMYHSVGKFDIEKGVAHTLKHDFSNEFGNIMVKNTVNNPKICAITAAMCEGTGLLNYSKQFPENFFDVGIAEEHQIAFAAGLASYGYLPVCAVYSTFSQRAFDQVFHDVAIQNLHIVLALDRSGFVADDGITHQGVFDVSLFSTIPNVTIYSPDSFDEMNYCFDNAFSGKGVQIVRYPKGLELDYNRQDFYKDGILDVVDCTYSQDNIDADVVFVTYGKVCANVVSAAHTLKECNISSKIIKLVKIFPIDYESIFEKIGKAKLICFVEEGMLNGGISQKIMANLAGKTTSKILTCTIDGRFANHASTEQLYEQFGMSSDKLVEKVKRSLIDLC